MSLAARFRGSSSRIVSHFGGGAKAVRTERSSLRVPATDAAPTLLVQGTTASGATSIILDAASMVGKVPAGYQFTLPADATVYTVTTDATAASNAVTLAINALTAEAADNAAVTVTQDYGEKTYRATRSHYKADEIGDTFGLEDYKLELATSDEFSPEDRNLTFDGSAVTIKAVEPFSPGTEQASVILHCAG